MFPITPQAKELLGERLEANQPILKQLKYSSKTATDLCRWAIAAGISKKITFHSARHTHATLLLSLGVDIYTVSKLLGHKHVVSTERYAHVADKLKLKQLKRYLRLFLLAHALLMKHQYPTSNSNFYIHSV